MSPAWNVLSGFIVTIITFILTQWEIKGKWNAVGTALKGIIALIVSMFMGMVEVMISLGTFSMSAVWENLPLIVAAAMSFYGIIVKPADKGITAYRDAKKNATTV
jgi:O-antigen ligase